MGIPREEEIRAAVDGMPRETLADALALLLAQGKAPSQQTAGMDKPDLKNCAQAIQYLKRNYQFPELEFFTTEADLVYVQAGDRRVLLTDRMGGTAAPDRGSMRYDDGAFENETAPPSLRPESPGAPGPAADPEESSGESPKAGGDSGRFSNLEL
ncbi:hypothetical protein [Breznakiella homolactica]|uniref:Uncharacterized protein n=1 Tax=Breznakiella homolactica TaxID=2798577 RepID=A0A7T7XMB7_9SPIR|nr:hypothetical protein [Breznakiella homolactica]QQO09000.1 hypothetical protein JFL75_19035 [Breznakiella homolactica]